MKKTLSATAVAIPLILLSTQTQIASAADSVALDNDGGLELSITANRREQEASKPLSAMTIITKQDIQKYQAFSVADVLRHVPGISIKNSGGVGKATSVFIRGTNSSHVLVLVDGVKIGSATLGTAPFEHLPVSQIERIEVLRGPRSSLYGSEAIGGVIQIFTTKAKEGKVNPQFSLGYGSHNTLDMSFGVSGSNGTNWYQFGVGKKKTDGFNSRDSYTAYPAPTYAPTEVKEKDKDGYFRDSLSLNLGHKFNNGAKAEFNLMDAQGENEYDGSPNETDFHERVVSVKLSGRVNQKLKLSGTIGSSLGDQDHFKDTVAKSSFTTKRNIASVLADISINNSNTLLLGIDSSKDKVSGTTAYSETSRTNDAVFASLQSTIGKYDVELSLRSDDNQQFGKHTTGGFAVGHNFTNGLRISSSYATAFKAPTFNDLYYPNSGNVALKPEKSKNIEIGLSKQTRNGDLSVSIYQNKIDSLINWAPDSQGNWKPANIDAVKIKGIELGHKINFAGWAFNTGLTFQKPEADKGVNKGKALRYRPEKILSLDADKTVGKFVVGASLQAESKRYTDQANTESLAGYATLDLRVNYVVAKDWNVGFKVGNVLDKEYKTNKGYNQAGTTAMLSVSYSPK